MIFSQPSLNEVLAERDRRSALRTDTFRKICVGGTSCILVQLSPVAPAELRDRQEVHSVFERGERRFEIAADAMGWNPVRIDSARTVLGLWTLWTVSSSAATPEKVKYLCMGLEEESPSGRLLDFDVEGQDGPVSRSAFGVAERACLVCGGSAAACSGRRIHDPDSVIRAFMRLFKLIPE